MSLADDARQAIEEAESMDIRRQFSFEEQDDLESQSRVIGDAIGYLEQWRSNIWRRIDELIEDDEAERAMDE